MLFKMKHLIFLRIVMGAPLVFALGCLFFGVNIYTLEPQSQLETQTLAVVKTFTGVMGGEGGFL